MAIVEKEREFKFTADDFNILRKISIQGYILENIEASIVHHNGAPLLFGLNAINKIGKITISRNFRFLRLY